MKIFCIDVNKHNNWTRVFFRDGSMLCHVISLSEAQNVINSTLASDKIEVKELKENAL